jgi:hypothetical protein
MTWANLNAKLKEIEKRVDKIEDLDLDSRLTEIQTNLKWIMERLKEKQFLYPKAKQKCMNIR